MTYGQVEGLTPHRGTPGIKRKKAVNLIQAHSFSDALRHHISSGDRIRTCDLWVMSPASYRAAPPRGGSYHVTESMAMPPNRVLMSTPSPCHVVSIVTWFHRMCSLHHRDVAKLARIQRSSRYVGPHGWHSVPKPHPAGQPPWPVRA